MFRGLSNDTMALCVMNSIFMHLQIKHTHTHWKVEKSKKVPEEEKMIKRWWDKKSSIYKVVRREEKMYKMLSPKIRNVFMK